MSLYVTADQIGSPSGGGLVTCHESEALKSLGPCDVWGRADLECQGEEPWKWDTRATQKLAFKKVDLCHAYAGTFSAMIKLIKENSGKVSYTAAAHNIELSRQAHEAVGLSFNHQHLTDHKLWKRYVAGYLAADVVICPSQHSAGVMREYGCKNVVVIPHGVDVPAIPAPLPLRFAVGYMGSWGADKSVVTLLKAWKKLKYKDVALIFAGRDSTSPWAAHLISTYGGGGPIQLLGWVQNISDFYNMISLYVQPSVSEGFGIEVLEAMAHGRNVICSSGAGAADVLPDCCKFPAGDVDRLTDMIDNAKRNGAFHRFHENAKHYTWDKIRARYIDVWKGLLT